MSSPLDAPAGSSLPYRFSLTRVLAVAFTVFVLAVAYGAYVDYFVKQRGYEATAKIEICLPRDANSPQPIAASEKGGIGVPDWTLSEMEFMSAPDVLSQIITDLQLDKIWARRERLAIDTLPMQDALREFHSMLHLEKAPHTRIVTITVDSVVPKESSDMANAVADRYKFVRELEITQELKQGVQRLEGMVVEQKSVVAQKATAIDAIRAQLEAHGIHVAPGSAGLIAADLAAQKNGSTLQTAALAPLRDAQAQLDRQQAVLDDLTMRKLQADIDVTTLPYHPVRILELAYPPEYPSLPNHEFNMWIAASAGLFLAVAVPLLLEFLLRHLGNLSNPDGQAPVLPRPVLTSAEY